LAAGPPRPSELIYEDTRISSNTGYWPNPVVETFRRLTGSPNKVQQSYKGENNPNYDNPNYINQFKQEPIYFVNKGESLYELDEVEFPNIVIVPECTSSVKNLYYVKDYNYNITNNSVP